jgi:hypothetical protein
VDAGGHRQLAVDVALQPPHPVVQVTPELVVGGLGLRIGLDLFGVGWPELVVLGAGGGQRPEGLLGVGAHPGHLLLGGRQHLGEAAECPGDLGEGALGGVQVRGDPGHPGPEQVALAADPGAGVEPAQAGGGLTGRGGEPPVGAARLADRLGIPWTTNPSAGKV